MEKINETTEQSVNQCGCSSQSTNLSGTTSPIEQEEPQSNIELPHSCCGCRCKEEKEGNLESNCIEKYYIGTKLVRAFLSSQWEFAKRNKKDKYPNDQDGYEVKYIDGYVSWSPKETFEEAYKLTTELNIGLAFDAVNNKKVASRRCWNEKYIQLFNHSTPTSEPIATDTPVNYIGYTDYSDSSFIINGPYCPTPEDIMATDWYIIEVGAEKYYE